LSAILVAAALDRDPARLAGRLVDAVRRHRLFFGATAAALLIAGAGALAGLGVFSVFGRYAIVGRVGIPNFWHFLYLLAQHIAGVDLAVGVVPFVGALVAAATFAQSRFPRSALPFAAVALSVTAWLLVEVALDAARFDRGAD